MRSSWCSSWRVSLFCYTRSLIPQSWFLLPPKTPLRYSLRSLYLLVGVRHHLELCSPAGHSAYFGLAYFMHFTFHVVFSSVHLQFYTTNKQPRTRAVIQSFFTILFIHVFIPALVFPNPSKFRHKDMPTQL